LILMPPQVGSGSATDAGDPFVPMQPTRIDIAAVTTRRRGLLTDG
jgi:hypothetical protein